MILKENIYACLLGKWECLNSDPHAIVNQYTDPVTWWNEQGDRMLEHDLVDIYYRDKRYQIHSSFIQIVHE